MIIGCGLKCNITLSKMKMIPLRNVTIILIDFHPKLGTMVAYDLYCFQIQNPASAILDENGLITAHVEWLECHLLYNDKYNRLDEINSRHKYQMA